MEFNEYYGEKLEAVQVLENSKQFRNLFLAFRASGMATNEVPVSTGDRGTLTLNYDEQTFVLNGEKFSFGDYLYIKEGKLKGMKKEDFQTLYVSKESEEKRIAARYQKETKKNKGFKSLWEKKK